MSMSRLTRALLAACLAGLCALAWPVPAAAQPEPDAAGDCGLDLEAMGIDQLAQLSNAQITPGHFGDYFLRAWMFRISSQADAEQMQRAHSTVEAKYRDIMLMFHRPSETLEPELDQWLAYITSLGRVVDEVRCDFASPETLTLYAPFVRDEGSKLVFSKDILAFDRPTVVRLRPGDFASLSLPYDPIGDLVDTAIAPNAEPDAALPDAAPEAPRPWQRNYYPWIAELDFAAAEPGEAVFALDKIECDRRGNFLLGSIGDLAGSVPGGRVGVTRREMIAANAYFGVSGDPEDEAVVAASVNGTAYWCIPKKEFCHQQVRFGDFGVTAQQDETTEFETTKVVSMRHGLVKAMQRLIMDYCPQSPIEQGVR